MRSLIGTVANKGINIRELLYHLIINIIKYYTVMDIAGSNFHSQNNTVDIAGGMGFIGQLLLVVTLYEQTAVRICGADDDGLLLCFLLAFL